MSTDRCIRRSRKHGAVVAAVAALAGVAAAHPPAARAAITKPPENPLLGADGPFLSEYLRAGEAFCPVCRHKLHALTAACCPKCSRALRIDVVAVKSHLRDWAALAGITCFETSLGILFLVLLVRIG
jgi:hypothetical protein